jgi:hypothetical protein
MLLQVYLRNTAMLFVLVGESVFRWFKINLHKAPKDVLFSNKAAAQQILVDDDLVKAPVYRSLQMDAKVTSLISERDKVVYKAKVSMPTTALERRLTENAIEKTPITGFLYQLFERIRAFDATMHPGLRRVP